ncbi:MAG: hypothetical protein OHK0024_24270 [Thalassobaculales bacterium]
MPSARLPRALMLALTLCVSACATAASDAACPPWPPAGAAVAAELDGLPAAEYPALWAWIERLARLRDQLVVCRGR